MNAATRDSWRLFIGVPLDDAWTEQLAATADRLRTGLGNRVRWVRPELYHVTVVFLGNHTPDAVPAILEALNVAVLPVEPFPLRLLDVRRIGGQDRGAIVAGVHDPTSRLQALRSDLDAELRALGFPFDAKPLRPHITLGRPRRDAGPLDVPRVNLGGSPPLYVGEVALFKSDLLPGGPRYEILESAALAPAD